MEESNKVNEFRY